MTSTAGDGAMSATRAMLIVRVSVGSDRRTDASPVPIDQHHRGNDRDADPAFHEPEHGIHLGTLDHGAGRQPRGPERGVGRRAEVVRRAEDDLRQLGHLGEPRGSRDR